MTDEYVVVKENLPKFRDKGYVKRFPIEEEIRVFVTRNPLTLDDVLCWMFMHPVTKDWTWQPIHQEDMWRYEGTLDVPERGALEENKEEMNPLE